MLTASLSLSPGPVGLVLPLRGAGQTSFSCRLSEVTEREKESKGEVLRVFPLQHLPDLLEERRVESDKTGHRDWGMLISSFLTVPVMNLLSTAVTVQLSIETPRQVASKLLVRVAGSDAGQSHSTSSLSSIEIEAGQLMMLPVEIYTENDETIYLPCRQGFSLPLTLTSSRSQRHTRLSVELQCRRKEQSFLFSFIGECMSLRDCDWRLCKGLGY
mmetsp:Transcript_37189/g.37869  ORF Transcript_37189/g.37869 Transcript_37189/m.37869 type:complete len:215 (-) Transcript_37189:2603-3247(-)